MGRFFVSVFSVHFPSRWHWLVSYVVDKPKYYYWELTSVDKSNRINILSMNHTENRIQVHYSNAEHNTFHRIAFFCCFYSVFLFCFICHWETPKCYSIDNFSNELLQSDKRERKEGLWFARLINYGFFFFSCCCCYYLSFSRWVR